MLFQHSLRQRLPLLAILVLSLNACVSTPEAIEEKDRLQPLNRKVHTFNNTLDQFSLRAAASAYEKALPSVVRKPVSNFFSNLGEIPTAAHSLLQGDFINASSAFMRFAVNTTFGLGGLANVASPMGIASRGEDMGQTLAKWNVPEGQYVVLPFLDASTFRDSLGLLLSYTVVPFSVVSLPTELILLNLVDTRVKLLPLDPIIRAQPDPYTFIRDAYRNRRRNQVANSFTEAAKDETFWEEEFGDEFEDEFSDDDDPDKSPDAQ